jgi:hypothetical protein
VRADGVEVTRRSAVGDVIGEERSPAEGTSDFSLQSRSRQTRLDTDGNTELGAVDKSLNALEDESCGDERHLERKV